MSTMKRISADAIMQVVIDLHEAQIAANDGKVDLIALKCSVARAFWGDQWSDDLLDELPPNIARCLERVVNVALTKHGLDQLFADIAARD